MWARVSGLLIIDTTVLVSGILGNHTYLWKKKKKNTSLWSGCACIVYGPALYTGTLHTGTVCTYIHMYYIVLYITWGEIKFFQKFQNHYLGNNTIYM